MPRTKGSCGFPCTRICHRCGERKPKLGFDQHACLCLSCRPDRYEWARNYQANMERDRRHFADVLPPDVAKKLKPDN